MDVRELEIVRLIGTGRLFQVQVPAEVRRGSKVMKPFYSNLSHSPREMQDLFCYIDSMTIVAM